MPCEEMPIAFTSFGSVFPTISRISAQGISYQQSGDCSVRPGRGCSSGTSRDASAAGVPRSSNRIALTAVVPRSTPI